MASMQFDALQVHLMMFQAGRLVADYTK